jgi:hypothetical protein
MRGRGRERGHVSNKPFRFLRPSFAKSGFGFGALGEATALNRLYIERQRQRPECNQYVVCCLCLVLVSRSYVWSIYYLLERRYYVL